MEIKDLHGFPLVGKRTLHNKFSFGFFNGWTLVVQPCFFMDHIAILRKSNIKKGDNLLKSILLGTKTIESRWYVHKIAPLGKIKVGETVYFKESGCQIKAKAIVSKLLFFDNLNPDLVENIIRQYGKNIAPDSSLDSFISWGKSQFNKKYCILIFLDKVLEIKPFNISKKGFGISAAWLCTPDINKIKVS